VYSVYDSFKINSAYFGAESVVLKDSSRGFHENAINESCMGVFLSLFYPKKVSTGHIDVVLGF
jgi:hypothetical protein